MIRITHREATGRQGRADRAFNVVTVAAHETHSAFPVRRLPTDGSRVRRAGEEATTLVLPVKGLNIPFADVALEAGDAVVVEWPQEQFVTVLGLVNRPGNFPYPPTARYRLIDAVGFAGGLDLVSDPRYVSVYRLRPDGTIAAMTVQLVNPKEQEHLTDALALPLSPGDVVSVEHTPRTRANAFFERVFRINLGLYLNPDDVWNND